MSADAEAVKSIHAQIQKLVESSSENVVALLAQAHGESKDMAMLILQLAKIIQKTDPQNARAKVAMEYVARKNLLSPFRGAASTRID